MRRHKRVEVVFSLIFKVQIQFTPVPKFGNLKQFLWGCYTNWVFIIHTSHTHPMMASTDNNNAVLATAMATGMVTTTAKVMTMAMVTVTAMPKVWQGQLQRAVGVVREVAVVVAVARGVARVVVRALARAVAVALARVVVVALAVVVVVAVVVAVALRRGEGSGQQQRQWRQQQWRGAHATINQEEQQKKVWWWRQ
jgi:hypothetical protein